ncbi:hypothetical protein HPULCUR_007317 [Helicostylum pulchrum]|uniref:Uncharacterized protein n=1 Tax=Helicostylum pulchrum TaxID=562976 RepID=A0ABP9Y6A6_9FUNG
MENYSLHTIYTTEFEVATNLPATTDSVIGLEIFDSLDITLSDEQVDMIYSALEYSLSFFPWLRNLDIKCGPQFMRMRYSISYKHKEDLTSSDPPNYKINCLQMRYIILVERYFNLVIAHLYDVDTVWLQANVMDCFTVIQL